jgi:hypothetical protein
VTWGAYGAVLTLTLLFMALLAWGIHRVGVTAGQRRGANQPREPEPPLRDFEPEREPAPVGDDVWPARIPLGSHAGSAARSS